MKIYVGNLPFSMTEDNLRKLFLDFGELKKVRLIMDRELGRSRGFGFVEMNDTDAKNAINTLNGTDYEGKKIIVNEARDKSQGVIGYENMRRSW